MSKLSHLRMREMTTFERVYSNLPRNDYNDLT